MTNLYYQNAMNMFARAFLFVALVSAAYLYFDDDARRSAFSAIIVLALR